MAAETRPTGARRAAPWLLGLAFALGAGLTGAAWFLGRNPGRPSTPLGAGPAPTEAALGLREGPGAALALGTQAGGATPDAENSARIGLAPESEAAALTWTGRVFDSAAETPVADARVVLRLGELERAAQTDAEGRFVLEWPADTAAQLEIGHAHYVDVRAPEVDLARPGEFGLTRSARLSGRVRPPPDGAGGAALVWHEVASSQRSWRARECALAADGAFAFEDLEPGEYVLGARVPDRVVAPEAGLRLEAGDQLEVALDARPGGHLGGRVQVAPHNRGLAEARLTLELQGNDLPREWRREAALEAATDANGRFAFEALAPGAWRLTAASDWGARTSTDVNVSESGERLEVELSLLAAGSLGGRVLDGAGAPRAGCELGLFQRSREASEFLAGEGAARAVSDAAGWFRIDAVPARERLQLAARAPAGHSIQNLAQFDSGEERLGLVVQLRADHALTGRVLGPAGEPIAGARVEVLTRLDNRTTHTARAESDGEGRFEVAGLPGTGGHVRAEADGWLQGGVDAEYAAGAVELVLARASHLEGRALDGQGFGVPDLPLTLEIVEPGRAAGERNARPERHSASSDEYGRFRFEGLRPGRWKLSGGSYAWSILGEPPQVDVPPDASLDLVCAREDRPERATLEGEVVCADGVPPTGVQIEGLRGGVLTVNGGRFRASGVTPTRLRLTLRADGHAGAQLEDIDLAPGSLHDVGQVVLVPATRLSVRVTAKGGGDLGGARLRLIPLPAEEGGAGLEARGPRFDTARTGRYETRDATRFAWRLVVDRPGYRRATRRIEVLAQERQDMEIELEPEG